MRLSFFSSVDSFFKHACAASGVDVWFLVGLFIYFHPSCVRTAKALAELRWCQLMRLSFFSSVDSFFKHACAASGVDVWFLVGLFIYFHPSCVRTAKALAELRWCAGLPQPSLVAYVISTISSWTSSIKNKCSLHCNFCQKTLCRKTNFAVKVPQWPYNDFKNKVMVIKT